MTDEYRAGADTDPRFLQLAGCGMDCSGDPVEGVALPLGWIALVLILNDRSAMGMRRTDQQAGNAAFLTHLRLQTI